MPTLSDRDKGLIQKQIDDLISQNKQLQDSISSDIKTVNNLMLVDISSKKYVDETHAQVFELEEERRILDGKTIINPVQQPAFSITSICRLFFNTNDSNIINFPTTTIDHIIFAPFIQVFDVTFVYPNVITRGSGSFIQDGWLSQQRLKIEGSELNDGIYTITNVNDLYLILDQTVMSEANVNKVKFIHPNIITRRSGSFIQDGWISQCRLKVTNSSLNDGIYTVIVVNDLELILSACTILTYEDTGKSFVTFVINNKQFTEGIAFGVEQDRSFEIINIDNSGDVIENYITAIDFPGRTFTNNNVIRAGTWTFNGWFWVDSISIGIVTVKFEVCKIDVNGIITSLFITDSTSAITAVSSLSAQNEIVNYIISSDISLLVTDRILVRVLAFNNSNVIRTIHWIYQGSARASFISTTFDVRITINDSRFIATTPPINVPIISSRAYNVSGNITSPNFELWTRDRHGSTTTYRNVPLSYTIYNSNNFITVNFDGGIDTDVQVYTEDILNALSGKSDIAADALAGQITLALGAAGFADAKCIYNSSAKTFTIASSNVGPTSTAQVIVNKTIQSFDTLALVAEQQTLTVDTKLIFPVNSIVELFNDENNRMVGSVVSYDPVTGKLIVNITTVIGSGMYSNWIINRKILTISDSALTINIGLRIFNVEKNLTTLFVGEMVDIIYDNLNFMRGNIISYNPINGEIAINATSIVSSGPPSQVYRYWIVSTIELSSLMGFDNQKQIIGRYANNKLKVNIDGNVYRLEFTYGDIRKPEFNNNLGYALDDFSSDWRWDFTDSLLKPAQANNGSALAVLIQSKIRESVPDVECDYYTTNNKFTVYSPTFGPTSSIQFLAAEDPLRDLSPFIGMVTPTEVRNNETSYDTIKALYDFLNSNGFSCSDLTTDYWHSCYSLLSIQNPMIISTDVLNTGLVLQTTNEYDTASLGQPRLYGGKLKIDGGNNIIDIPIGPYAFAYGNYSESELATLIQDTIPICTVQYKQSLSKFIITLTAGSFLFGSGSNKAFSMARYLGFSEVDLVGPGTFTANYSVTFSGADFFSMSEIPQFVQKQVFNYQPPYYTVNSLKECSFTLSGTPLTIGLGTKTLITVDLGLIINPGQYIVLANTSSNEMIGTVTSYNPLNGSLVVNITSTVGSGSYDYWNVFYNFLVYPELGYLQSEHTLLLLSTSNTSLLISTGSQTLHVNSTLSLSFGQSITIYYDNTHTMIGTVISYNPGPGTLIVNITSITGSGTFNSWYVLPSFSFSSWHTIASSELSVAGNELLVLGQELSNSMYDPINSGNPNPDLITAITSENNNYSSLVHCMSGMTDSDRIARFNLIGNRIAAINNSPNGRIPWVITRLINIENYLYFYNPGSYYDNRWQQVIKRLNKKTGSYYKVGEKQQNIVTATNMISNNNSKINELKSMI